jgi:hypothetical protein
MKEGEAIWKALEERYCSPKEQEVRNTNLNRAKKRRTCKPYQPIVNRPLTKEQQLAEDDAINGAVKAAKYNAHFGIRPHVTREQELFEAFGSHGQKSRGWR